MAANAPPTPAATRPVTPSASDSSSSTDGPVLSLINKRLRALRKKHNRITQMEDSLAQGKVLNKEQEETLRSKTVVLAQIEELEKLKQPLAVAVAEEHAVAVKKYLESEKEKEASARVSAEEGHVALEEVEDRKEQVEDDESAVGVVGDVLKLLYFGSIFDVKTQSEFTSTMLTRTHERGCCLTYDYVTEDAVDVLGEKDLDFISQLGSFLTSRPMDSSLSHKDALERCVEHAKLWLAKAEQPIGPDTSITCILDDEGHYQGQTISDNEYNHEEEAQKFSVQDEVAGDHYEVSLQQEQGYTGQNQRESEQFVQRRGYQNQGYQNQRGGRGGGRRGYSNGRGFRGGSRGGGPYQNGRNQYYDQPGNYYPRNNYNGRGRGGRGPGGHGYNQYGSNAHAGHPAGDVGIAS
uniref:Glycine-rich protein n=1 Tax=Kalanchoe fedtschenkoi TaxID=63787 RepID=A0A7N1A539_KALFE